MSDGTGTTSYRYDSLGLLVSTTDGAAATVHFGHDLGGDLTRIVYPGDQTVVRSFDAAGALGFVRHQDRANRYVVTRGELLDDLCVLMGGREAELLLLDDLSIGSAEDLLRATGIARALVEEFGMGGDEVGVCRDGAGDGPGRHPQLSPAQLEALDLRVRAILEDARLRAAAMVAENRAVLETLRDLLLEKKVIDALALSAIVMARARAA